MRARAAIRAESDGAGGLRLAVLRSEAPLLLRRTADAVHIVGGAAGPLGGDQLGLSIVVCSGAVLRVRSVAASIAQPDPAGRPSEMTIDVHVEAGAALDWAPEPLVVTTGAHHRIRTQIHLSADAAVRWRDVTVLGRHDEPPGQVDQELLLARDGAELLCQQHSWGVGAPGGWSGPAVLAGARVIATELAVPSATPVPPPPADPAAVTRASVLPFAPGCELRTAMSATVPAALATLDGLTTLDRAAGAALV
jgi:urease accessory protein